MKADGVGVVLALDQDPLPFVVVADRDIYLVGNVALAPQLQIVHGRRLGEQMERDCGQALIGGAALQLFLGDQPVVDELDLFGHDVKFRVRDLEAPPPDNRGQRYLGLRDESPQPRHGRRCDRRPAWLGRAARSTPG